MKEGEEFKISKKVGEKGCALCVFNERGQLVHLQCELVASLWPVNAFYYVVNEDVITNIYPNSRRDATGIYRECINLPRYLVLPLRKTEKAKVIHNFCLK